MSVYCLECFYENPSETAFCEECGYLFSRKQKKISDVLLKERYKFISPLSVGGGGKIFLTYDIRLNKTCVTKESYR